MVIGVSGILVPAALLVEKRRRLISSSRAAGMTSRLAEMNWMRAWSSERAVSLSLALWMLPVVLGLALAIPLALLTGRRWGATLLRTPEDVAPPAVVARAAALQPEWEGKIAPGVARLLRDPRLMQAHRAMLPPARRPRLDPIDPVLVHARAKLDKVETLEDALAALPAPELAAVLGNRAALDRLCALR